MKVDVAEALEALSQAIYNEQDGMDFYCQAEEAVDDPRGKAMYRSLIGDEEGHLRILSREYDSLAKAGQWAPLEEVRERGIERRWALFPVEHSGGIIFRRGMSDIEAMDLAMDFERKGYELYEKAAREAASAMAVDVFRFLALQENNHYATLQKSRDYLANNGVWYYDDVHAPQLD